MNSVADGVPFTTLTYSTGPSKNYQYEVGPDNAVHRKDPTAYNTTSFNYNQQAGILNDEATHGGVDVPIYATGTSTYLLSFYLSMKGILTVSPVCRANVTFVSQCT